MYKELTQFSSKETPNKQTNKQKNQLKTGQRLPGGPVIKSQASKAGNAVSTPGQGGKIPRAMGQLSPRTTTAAPVSSGTHIPQLRPGAAK